MEPKKMYIDGEWVTGSMEKPFDIINPATGKCSRRSMKAV